MVYNIYIYIYIYIYIWINISGMGVSSIAKHQPKSIINKSECQHIEIPLPPPDGD